MRKMIIVAIAFFFVGAGCFCWIKRDEITLAFQKIQLPAETTAAQNPGTENFFGINLAVPFSSQAPGGDWNLPYQEACEETSAILVDHFWRDEELTPELAEREILDLVAWEKNYFGYFEHTTAAETGEILREYFGYENVAVEYDISLEEIKNYILAGRPVIVPLAGREIGNPFFTPPGPIYHMLVIKGLTADGDFITNDVGTRRGQNYIYDDEILFAAIHDAPADGGELTNEELEKEIPNGRKAIIVVSPNTNF